MQTLTSLLQLLPPDVLSLYIRPLPMEHFVSCALFLFSIPAQLTLLSRYLSTRSSTTHHYITACICLWPCCLHFPQHHTYFLMHSSLPCHGAASWHCTILSTAPNTFYERLSHIRGPEISLLMSLPLYHRHIPISFVNHSPEHLYSFLPFHISIPVAADWKKKYL